MAWERAAEIVGALLWIGFWIGKAIALFRTDMWMAIFVGTLGSGGLVLAAIVFGWFVTYQ